MLYNRLGNSGLIVSRLSFGTMTFTGGGTSMPGVAKIGKGEAAALVDAAIAGGVNFFDTADVYSDGEAEEILGQIIADRRHDLVIATKAGFRLGKALGDTGLSRRHLLWSIEQSLKRLGTDYVDVFIAHRPDPYTPLEETLSALDTIVQHGKARYLGFSNWLPWQVAAAVELQRANGWAPFTHGQMYYSLVGRDLESEAFGMLAHYGLGLTVWSPLAGGFLSGKYMRETLSDPDNRLSSFDVIPFDKEMGFAVVDALRDIAKAHAASVAQVALAWLLAKDKVSSILVGASKPHQLADNLAATDVLLAPEQIARLDALTTPAATYPAWFVNGFVDRALAGALAPRSRQTHPEKK
ncbi:aldo/keto reductase [Sphingomonas sp. 28-62-11]|uniref:aldo/keto reductase n=1 Tax=Sphingomonas sp. 28-62-11 TaxID=1970432 RepID=UPI000BD80459|nr:MAG: aldo/keto reductase [Sphingomonas sp. 28-62-11]